MQAALKRLENRLHGQQKERAIFETVCVTRDGRVMIIEVNSGPIVVNGKVVGTQGIARDVTERRKMQEALAEREEQLSDFFENARDFIYMIDAEGRITYANKAMQEAYGYTLEEMREISPLDFIAPEYREIAQQKLDVKRIGNEKTSFEIVSLTKNGKRIILEVNNRPMSKDGEIVGIQGIARDITDRKIAEQKIQESEAELRAIFESMSDVIIVINKEGRMLKIPQTRSDFFIKPPEELFGKTIHEFIPEETANLVLEKLRESLRKKKTVSLDYGLDFQGTYRWFTVVFTPMTDETVMTVTREITNSKKAEMELSNSEKRYRELFENANDLIYTTDLKGNFTSMNRTGEKITGYKRQETLRGKINLAQIVAPEHLGRAVKEMREKLKGKKPAIYDLEIISAKGKRIPLELSTRVIYQDGKPVGMQGIARDVSERKKSEAALKASERQYRLLSEGIMHLVWTAKPDGEPDFLNGRGLEYFGKSIDELSNQRWISLIHADDVQEGLDKWKNCVETGELFEYEFRLLRHDGVYRWYRAIGTAGLDSKGNVIKWFGTCTDIHAQKLAEEKLKHLARHDSLTNLPNRAKFMEHLKRVINRDEMFKRYKFAVLFLDLDRFKVINDSLGHVVGDKLLIALAERLESCIRPGDIVARMGGDEFTILLNNLREAEDVLPVTNRLTQVINQPFYIDEYEVFTSASIGIVVSDEIERDPIGFLRDADAAMYRAKESGKARYEIFNEEMHIKNMALLRIENDLRKAIERNESGCFISR